MDEFKLSNQAMLSFVFLLQKALMEGKDISDMMASMKFVLDDNNELVCLNPPVVSSSAEVAEELTEYIPEE
jgi:hypothetical protein